MDIFSGHKKFLGFSWPCSGKVGFFTFRVLQFGLSSACFCFTKLLRPLRLNVGVRRGFPRLHLVGSIKWT